MRGSCRPGLAGVRGKRLISDEVCARLRGVLGSVTDINVGTVIISKCQAGRRRRAVCGRGISRCVSRKCSGTLTGHGTGG